QHAEKIAEMTVAERSDDIRIQKTYRIVFGRAATPEELAAGREFLAAEPMKQVDEQKAEKEKDEKDKKDKAGDKADGDNAAAKPADPADAGPPPPANMMAGVTPAGGSTKDEKERLPVTVFGRYVKVLLSSNEFIFVR